MIVYVGISEPLVDCEAKLPATAGEDSDMLDADQAQE